MEGARAGDVYEYLGASALTAPDLRDADLLEHTARGSRRRLRLPHDRPHRRPSPPARRSRSRAAPAPATSTSTSARRRSRSPDLVDRRTTPTTTSGSRSAFAPDHGAGPGVRQELEHRRRAARSGSRRLRARRSTRSSLAGAVAISGGGSTGVGVSGAGVFTQNKIGTDVKAFVQGDGDGRIRATSISITADDSSGIRAIAGAASVAVALSGGASVAVSIGLAIALNEVADDVAAYILGAATTVDAGSGNIIVAADLRTARRCSTSRASAPTTSTTWPRRTRTIRIRSPTRRPQTRPTTRPS